MFVSAYNPCYSPKGLKTVWRQQARYFKREETIGNPDAQALFICDLVKFLGDLRDEGNNVVLGMDANDDVRDGELTKALWEVGIFEAVVSNHKEKSVPATCAKNTQQKPIDSIWTSPGLTVLRCGFLPFHDRKGFQSDHRMVWSDICNEDLLGHRPQYIYRAPRAKERSNDPDIRDKFIQRCLKKYGNEDVINEFQTLTYFCEKQREGKD